MDVVIIGEAEINGVWYPVYESGDDGLEVNYPASHIWGPIPDRLKKKNID